MMLQHALYNFIRKFNDKFKIVEDIMYTTELKLS